MIYLYIFTHQKKNPRIVIGLRNFKNCKIIKLFKILFPLEFMIYPEMTMRYLK